MPVSKKLFRAAPLVTAVLVACQANSPIQAPSMKSTGADRKLLSTSSVVFVPPAGSAAEFISGGEYYQDTAATLAEDPGSYFFYDPASCQIQFFDGAYTTYSVRPDNTPGWPKCGTTPTPSPGPSSTPTPVPSPTPAPTAIGEVTLDGRKVYDGTIMIPQVIDSSLPFIKVKINGATSSKNKNYDWKSNTHFFFSARADDTIPKEIDQWKQYNVKTGVVSYQVPPDEAQILYIGDQTLTLTVTGPDGVTETKEIPISVGTKTLIAQIPGEGTSTAAASAYSLESVGSGPLTEVPRGEEVQGTLPAPYNDASKYFILSTKTLKYFKRASTVPVEEWVAPAESTYIVVDRQAVAEAAALDVGIVGMAGAAAIVTFVFSMQSDSAVDATKQSTRIAYNIPGLGLTTTNDETWSRISQLKLLPGDTSITKSMLARAELAMTDKKEKEKYELWTDAVSNEINSLQIYKQNGILYHLLYQTVGGNESHLLLCSPAGLELATSAHWPQVMNVPQLGWSDTASKIMRYYPDYNRQGDRHVWGLNYSPKFPYYVRGNIPDPVDKPYKVGNNTLYSDGLTNRAVPLLAKTIGSIVPSFTPDSLTRHWSDHMYEFTTYWKANKKTPYDNAAAYEVGAQSNLMGLRGLRYYRRGVNTDSDGSVGDLVIWDPRTSVLCIWGINNTIRTQYILGFNKNYPLTPERLVLEKGALNWSKKSSVEAQQPYDPNHR